MNKLIQRTWQNPLNRSFFKENKWQNICKPKPKIIKPKILQNNNKSKNKHFAYHEGIFSSLPYLNLISCNPANTYIWSLINAFHVTDLFLYPLKTSENFWFSVFRGYRKRPVAWNGLSLNPIESRMITKPSWQLLVQS